MYQRVLLAIILGTLTGLVLERGSILPRSFAERSSDVGLLVIRLLKALATPLILFAVLDAFLRTQIPARKGGKLVLLSLVNAAVAILIGLGVANVLRTGDSWKGKMDEIAAQLNVRASAAAEGAKGAEAPTLDPIKNISRFIPDNFVDPFGKNNVITVVLIAVLAGAALRKVKDRGHPDSLRGVQLIDEGIHAVFEALTQMLEWVVWLIPFAIFFVIAGVVGKTGTGVFGLLASYVGTIVLGLFLHAVVYYSFLLFAVARVSPLTFFREAMDSIVTALSSGSSLATLPVTLRCLQDKLKVSPSSARLAACVGTNLNHDGIILYEAAATLFLAQALGRPAGIDVQVVVAFASIMAGIGIAGVPDAGLITLSLVLGAAGLPAELYVLFVPVDWLIGRCRAATNVISDMTVAQVLDRFEPDPVR
jgi:DAACS family dicarboxylate/amino acid:cation (Na+ or H+) symporter